MSQHGDVKPTAKTAIRAIVDAQPDDASYDDIIRELAFMRLVDRGLADVRAGRSSSHEDALASIRAWRG